MKCEIIAIGDEVVKGYTVNTNASFIAKRMQEMGIYMSRHTAIGDDPSTIKESLQQAMERSEWVWIIGGLGPTEDDLTKEAVCEVLNMPMVFHEGIYDEIKAYFSKTGRKTPDNNKKQAYFPKDAVILPNPNGTAPGCLLKSDTKHIVLLPGPPKELVPMVENYVIPYLEKQKRKYFAISNIKVFGIGESHLAEQLGNQLGVFEWGSVATYVGKLEIVIRIHMWGDTKEEADRRKEEAEKKIVDCLGEYIIGYNDKQLEENIVDLLKKQQYTIATAESCTGGLVVGTLINCGGISEWLGESIVTYSNEAKMKYLGVKEETLKAYGAVSAETAEEMARGIQRQAHAKIGLSTTGIAGPGGGTPNKPVGTVYIGIALGINCYTYHLKLDGDRQEIRKKTVKQLLYKLYKHLQEDCTCIHLEN